MPSPILARADALMQRRRSNADADDVPVLTDTIDPSRPETDDDIPVLRDIEASVPRRPITTAPSPPPDPPQVANPEDVPFPTLISEPIDNPAPAAVVAPPVANREDIARDIARRVQRRLVAELPRLIAAAVTDYLAEQDTTR